MSPRSEQREIESKTRPPGVIPYIRNGVALVTLLAFHRRSFGCTVNRTEQDFYGDRNHAPHPPNLLGIGVEEVANRFFGGYLTGREILQRHTLFGFYSRLLPQDVKEKWANDLANFRGRSVATYLDLGAGPLTTLGALRKCTSCIDTDRQQGEIPGWRVLHQLPLLDHCVEHGEMLSSICAACKRPFERGGEYRLPSDPCVHCGNSELVRGEAERRSGQLILGELCSRIFTGSVPDLEQAHWPAWVAETVERLGGHKNAVKRIERRLAELWEVKAISHVSLVLDRMLPDDFVSLELKLLASPRVVLPRLLVFIAGESLGLAKPSGTADTTTRHLETLDDERVDRLIQLATSSAIPRGVIDRLLAGAAAYEVVGRQTISRRRLQAFLESLPADLSRLLAGCHLTGSATRRILNPDVISKREEIRAGRREEILQLILANEGLTRFEASQLTPTSYRWMTTNDAEWLASVLPSRATTKDGVSRYRNKIEQRDAHRLSVMKLLLTDPKTGRSDAVKKRPTAMKWLLAKDRPWCDKNVPVRARMYLKTDWYKGTTPLVFPEPILKRRYKNLDERIAAAKKFVAKVRALNPHLLKSQITRIATSSVSCLRIHDPDWIECELLRAAKPKTKKPAA